MVRRFAEFVAVSVLVFSLIALAGCGLLTGPAEPSAAEPNEKPAAPKPAPPAPAPKPGIEKPAASKPAAEKQSEAIMVRVTPGERKQLEAEARRLGVPLAAVLTALWREGKE